MSSRRQSRLATGSAPPDAWGRLGQIVGGRLRLTRVIGGGPHGTVYEALDQIEHRAVAVKVLHARTSSVLTGYEREVQLSHPFVHPNLVALDAIGRLDDGSIYTVTELVTGIDLGSVLAEGTLSERAALRMARHALLGLQELHRTGAAHGDLKPENLIVAGIGVFDDNLDEPVRVVDVGLATLFRATRNTSRLAPVYMPPEVRVTGIPSQRGDVYAMGAVLAEMVGADPRDPVDAADLGDQTAFILWRARQDDPRDRYRDATDMLVAVDAALRAQPRLPS